MPTNPTQITQAPSQYKCLNCQGPMIQLVVEGKQLTEMPFHLKCEACHRELLIYNFGDKPQKQEGKSKLIGFLGKVGEGAQNVSKNLVN